MLNVLLQEESHSSLDGSEQSPHFITSDSFSEQNGVSLYSLNEPTSVFEAVCDQNNFLDLQKKFSMMIEVEISQNDGSDLRYEATNALQPDTLVFVINTLHSS